MNVDILDQDGVIITTAAIDDGFWRAAAPQLAARIAPTGMALNAPGSNSAERRVNNIGGFDAWVQSATFQGERDMRPQPHFGRPHPHFGFGRPHPHFGLGDAALVPQRKTTLSLTDEAKDALKMGGAGTAAFLVAKSIGAGLLGATAAAAGGVAFASAVIARKIRGA
jgi:hypothetical protein